MTEFQSDPGAGVAAERPVKLPNPSWIRKEREAAFGLLAGTDGFSLPSQGSVSREFADGRYREVTARISATSKDFEQVLEHREKIRPSGRTVPVALAWTLGAIAVVFVAMVLGELAGAAGSAILDSMNE